VNKLLITGNPNKGLAQSLFKLWPNAVFASRQNGWDLTNDQRRRDLAQEALKYDVFINNSALWQFQQTLVLQEVYKAAKDANHNLRIICIGSTTDRTSKASDWIYQQEKKALRSYCNSLGLLGTWSGGPRVTLLSFGTLSNNQHKHPNRTCMDIDVAANYVKWILDQPTDISINELSIDPVQENKNVQ
jgi:hypothetical protein